jgi:hypothetical protein
VLLGIVVEWIRLMRHFVFKVRKIFLGIVNFLELLVLFLFSSLLVVKIDD